MSRQKKTASPPPARPVNSRFNTSSRIALGTAVMLFLTVGVGGWAATAKLSGAIISSGSVIVDQKVKKLQHRDGGIVAKINVKDGDQIRAGEVLVVLDGAQIAAEIAILRSQLTEFKARQARLLAERDGATTVTFPNDIATLGPDAEAVMKQELRLFDENRKSLDSNKQQLQLRIEQLGEEINGLTAQRDAKKSEMGLIDQELDQVRVLSKRKLVPLARLLAVERDATRIKGEHGGLISQIARAKGQISETALQVLAIEQTSKVEAQRELGSAEARIAELMERHIAALDRLTRLEMRAPITGTVHQLAIHTIGGVVSPAEPVLLIVPSNDALAIEARFAPVDIDQLSIGQDVRVRFSAFNQRTTPEMFGHITSVAADVVTDQASGQKFYLGTVVIDQARSPEFARLKLMPGMPAEVFVTTAERTVLSYFSKPIVDQFAKTFREE